MEVSAVTVSTVASHSYSTHREAIAIIVALYLCRPLLSVVLSSIPPSDYMFCHLIHQGSIQLIISDACRSILPYSMTKETHTAWFFSNWKWAWDLPLWVVRPEIYLLMVGFWAFWAMELGCSSETGKSSESGRGAISEGKFLEFRPISLCLFACVTSSSPTGLVPGWL